MNLSRLTAGFAGAILVLFVATILPMRAHGGGEIQISREPAGPFRVSAWLNPPQPQAGETTHLTIGVLGENDTAVLDATVQIMVTEQSTGQVVVNTPATTAQSANRLFYEADFIIPEVGEHEIRVVVDRDGLGGEVAFTTAVVAPRFAGWLWVGLGIVLGLTGFVYWRSRHS